MSVHPQLQQIRTHKKPRKTGALTWLLASVVALGVLALQSVLT